MKKLLVAVIALAIFAGVGWLLAGQLNDTAFRRAEATRDACYASQGYFLGTGQAIPDTVRTQCTQPIRDYENGRTMNLVYGGLAGLAAAGLFLLLAWLLLFRGRPRAGAQPPPY